MGIFRETPAPSEEQSEESIILVPDGLKEGCVRLIEELQKIGQELDLNRRQIDRLKPLWDALYENTEKLPANSPDWDEVNREFEKLGDLLGKSIQNYETNLKAAESMYGQFEELMAQRKIINSPGGQA